MIRKAFIVALALATMSVAVLQVVSFGRIIHWSCYRSQARHMCIELRDGNAFLHYMCSDYEPFLDIIDEHEGSYARWLGHSLVSYAESERSWRREEEAEPGWAPPPIRTYAWSHRFGFPLVVLIVLFLFYPALAFARGPFRRWRRRRRGVCLKCGYDLTGNVSGVCPECGTPI